MSVWITYIFILIHRENVNYISDKKAICYSYCYLVNTMLEKLFPYPSNFKTTDKKSDY